MKKAKINPAIKPRESSLLTIAFGEIGTKEYPDPGENPRIVEYLKTVGQPGDDEIPWCAAFANWCLARAGIVGTNSAAARSFLSWTGGEKVNNPLPGDLVVFWRGSPDSWQGHVAFFVGYDDDKLLCIGGNQSNAVTIASYGISRVLAYIRPKETSKK